MTSLNSFIRDTAYFQIRRDQQLLMNAEDFDFQFINFINYINNKITPVINKLEEQVIPGTDEEGTANTFLRNIGDGTTEWATINNEAVNNYSIAFSKLVQAATGSIFATANDRVFKVVTPASGNQILSSVNNSLPVWQKAKGDNFETRSITGRNIGFSCIGLEHLSPDVTGRPVNENSVLGRHILDLSIPGSKFADNSITETNIPNALNTERATNINAGRFTLLDNSLENRHFPNSFLREDDLVKRINVLVDDNVNYIFTSNNIDDSAIGNAPYNASIDTTRCFINGAINQNHITFNSFEFMGNFPGTAGNTKIRKEKLSPQLRQRLGI